MGEKDDYDGENSWMTVAFFSAFVNSSNVIPTFL